MKVIERRAIPFVGARFGRDVDQAPREPRGAHGVVGRDQRSGLDGVEVDRRAAGRIGARAEAEVVLLQRAVDGESVEPRVDASHREVPLAGRLRKRVAQQRADDVARDRRLVRDVGCGVCGPDAVVEIARGIQGARRDEDLLDLEGHQRDSEWRLRAGSQRDPRELAVPVAVSGNAYFIGAAHPQTGLVEGAVVGGDGRPGRARGRVYDLDSGPCDWLAGGRADVAVQRGRGYAGDRDGCRQRACGTKEAANKLEHGLVHVGGLRLSAATIAPLCFAEMMMRMRLGAQRSDGIGRPIVLCRFRYMRSSPC